MRNRDHDHCPDGCEHPQPFADPDTGRRYCGRCWCVFGELVEVVPCTDDVC
jgi:hypothetical protein